MLSGIVLTPGSKMLSKKKIQCCLPQGSSLEFRRENRHAWEKKKHMQITIRLQILTGN